MVKWFFVFLSLILDSSSTADASVLPFLTKSFSLFIHIHSLENNALPTITIDNFWFCFFGGGQFRFSRGGGGGGGGSGGGGSGGGILLTMFRSSNQSVVFPKTKITPITDHFFFFFIRNRTGKLGGGGGGKNKNNLMSRTTKNKWMFPHDEYNQLL